MTILNPQLTVDAQAVIIFGQSVIQSIAKFANVDDATTPEYKEGISTFKEYAPKLIAALEKLEADVG